jgi:hypothetical protein
MDVTAEAGGTPTPAQPALEREVPAPEAEGGGCAPVSCEPNNMDVTAEAGGTPTPAQPALEREVPAPEAEGGGCAPVAFKRRPTVAELREKYPPTPANLAAFAFLEASEHLDNSEGRYPGGGGRPRPKGPVSVSAKTVVQALGGHGAGPSVKRTAKAVREGSDMPLGKCLPLATQRLCRRCDDP